MYDLIRLFNCFLIIHKLFKLFVTCENSNKNIYIDLSASKFLFSEDKNLQL